MSIPRIVNGRPVRPQLERLMTAFGDKPVGTILTHADISAAMGERHGTSRYRSVVAAWKKRMLREKGINVASEHSVGYALQTPSAQVRTAAVGFSRGIRQSARAVVLAQVVKPDDLSEHQRRARDHMLTRGVELLEVAKQEAGKAARMLGDGANN